MYITFIKGFSHFFVFFVFFCEREGWVEILVYILLSYEKKMFESQASLNTTIMKCMI